MADEKMKDTDQAASSIQQRASAYSKDIMAGKRRPARKPADLPGEDETSYARKILEFIKNLGKLPFKFVYGLLNGVIRKTTDKLAGTNWEETTKQAKADMMALDEISDEEQSKFQQKTKEQQQRLAELHLAQSRLDDDQRASTTREIMGEEEASLPDEAAYEQGAFEATTVDSVKNANPSSHSVALIQLQDMYRAYTETPDDRFDAVIQEIRSEAADHFTRSDMAGIVTDVQKTLCALDPMLGGRSGLEKELIGPNAVARIGVNQVIAYEIAEKLLNDAIRSGNPAGHLRSLAPSHARNAMHRDEFLRYIQHELHNYVDTRETLYRKAKSPNNDPADFSWAWIEKASHQFGERLKELEAISAELSQESSRPSPKGLPDPSGPKSISLEAEVEGEKPSEVGNKGQSNQQDAENGIRDDQVHKDQDHKKPEDEGPGPNENQAPSF